MSKFMSYQDRLAIEKGLTEHKSFGKIGKGRTTVAKEIKKYSYEKKAVIPPIRTMPARNAAFAN